MEINMNNTESFSPYRAVNTPSRLYKLISQYRIRKESLFVLRSIHTHTHTHTQRGKMKIFFNVKPCCRIHQVSRQKHLCRWKACKGRCQSKTLISGPLPSWTKTFKRCADRSLTVLRDCSETTKPSELLCSNWHSDRTADCAGAKRK